VSSSKASVKFLNAVKSNSNVCSALCISHTWYEYFMEERKKLIAIHKYLDACLQFILQKCSHQIHWYYRGTLEQGLSNFVFGVGMPLKLH
jgi:hypothetical protein